MSTQISIYKKIEEIIKKEGQLPENFEAEERNYADDELRFAPGALEGILGHHSSGEGGKTEFLTTLKKYIAMTEQEAMENFEEEVAKDFKAATEGQSIIEGIIENKQEYPAGRVFSIAFHFVENGRKVETVKLGLCLLRLFDVSEEERIRDLLEILGYCEDFTDYVIDNTALWKEDKRQDLYFKLAKKLHGWGKINVVEMLEADTEEKKEWILCHGCKNSILYAYLGGVCAIKSDLYERLKQGNLTEEQMRGASDIMDGLIDVGPCNSMKEMENPVDLTLSYIEELKNHKIDLVYIDLLYRLAEYFKNEEYEEEDIINAKVKEITDTVDIRQMVIENIKDNSYMSIQIANACNIDLSGQILELIRENFSKHFNLCYYLLEREKYVDEFFELCDEKINEEDYPKGMGKSFGFGKPENGTVSLDMAVQHLDRFPLKGKKMIKISINSPITRWRNMAAKAMLGWVEKLDKKLSEIDMELYLIVENVVKTECNDTTKEMWEKLLNKA